MHIHGFIATGLLGFCLFLPTVGTTAPEPAKVRLSLWSGEWYLNHGGGNETTVGAPSASPQTFYAEADAGDIWYIVDWNGRLLTNGDKVSLATKQVKQPYYLSAPSCDRGSLANTRRQAIVESGIGANAEFNIIKVAKSTNSDGQIIRNGDAVAFETTHGCYLDFDGSPLPIYTDQPSINDTTTWQIWFKVKPQEGDDFLGHIQTCFGGAGASCWRNLNVDDDDWFVDGRGGFRNIYVSVGSILHDNCCLRNPLGKNCGGVFTGGTQMRDGTRPGRGTMAVFQLFGEIWQGTRCEWEWEKAVQNWWDGHNWRHWFGPYSSSEACPGCETTGEKAWGLTADHLRARETTRDSSINHNSQQKVWPHDMATMYPDDKHETDTTLQLKAPGNTIIQYWDDKDFCDSRQAYWVGGFKCITAHP